MINENDQKNDQKNDQNEDKQNLELLPYMKNVSFKWEKLELNNDFNFLTNDVTFNLWDNNFNLQKKMHINDNFDIHYKNGEGCVYFKLKIEYINGTIERGKIKRIHYFRPTSLIQTGLIYDIFAVLEDKICEKFDINFLDIIDKAGLIRIDTKQRLPLNKVVYLRDLIVVFDRIEKVTYREKNKYCIVSTIISGDVLLQK